MAFGHGSKGVFKLDNSAGTLVDLSAYITSVEFPESLDTAEVSVLGLTSKTYVLGLKDATLSLDGNWDSVLDAHMSALISALQALTLATATYEYGPAGSTTGLVRYTAECLVTAYNLTTAVSDAQKWTATLQGTGNITRNTWP